MSGVRALGVAPTTVAPEGLGAPAPTATAAPASLLPDPATELMMSGDPGAMVAALGVTMAQGEAHVSRTIDDLQTQLQEQEDSQAVAAMHAKAESMMATAIEGAVVGSVAGVVSGAAAGFGDATAGKALLTGSAKVGDAFQALVTGHGAAKAEDMEADVTQWKDDAGRAGTAASHAYDGERDAKKLLDAAADFFREYSSAKDQADAAAIFKG